MRRLMTFLIAAAAFGTAAFETTGFGTQAFAADQPPATPAAADNAKQNANPCRDEVSAALQKLRKSSWFRMESNMLTENGPTTLEVDYILPDKMHQKTVVVATKQTSEMILIGKQAWQNEGNGWDVVPESVAQQYVAQMYENVIETQVDVGNYACKGRMKIEGRDVMGYKLEDEPVKDSQAPKNEAFRMFFVDAVTGLPSSNELVTPGREGKPFFKTSYSYPIDIKIEAPKDVKPAAAAAPAATPVPEQK